MKTRAAIIHGVGHDRSVEEIELDPPSAGEGRGGTNIGRVILLD